MLHYALLFLFLFDISSCRLWKKGVVHYAINKKDYGKYTFIIMSTFSQIENEICVKFFNTPLNYTASESDKILYISNPDKRKNCSPENYNFTGSLVDMLIGYKCLNQKDISRVVVEMLRASVEQTGRAKDLLPPHNEVGIQYKKKSQHVDPSRPTLLSPTDRNYINAHYHELCGQLAQHPAAESRRFSGLQMSADNEEFYADKMWRMAVVMYGVEEKLRDSQDHVLLRYAMNTIEMATCLVFQEVRRDRILKPRSLLWLSSDGEEMPYLGFKEGNQTVSLSSMCRGAPGHVSHTLNVLLRVLGVPMMSNRYDRDNYVTVNWRNVDKGEFIIGCNNYMCGNCAVGVYTVQPVQDHLWQRALYMGHRPDLSDSDVEMLNILYAKECQKRVMSDSISDRWIG
ncbi:hypothetical protein K1T71_014870 [Dendrolimus kikuchii]|nr:hypothetical protein K1T71_014870 [Dendrolimus kikuchii]